jgi:hypothetical protein
MSDPSDAWSALRGPGMPLAAAQVSVPKSPGLYAIYGPPSTWNQLGLGDPDDERPLYVGKSESNLADRDLRTHFGDGHTGSSTVRRSFAALLRESLGLRAIPRNPVKPDHFDRYALSPTDDAKLTRWMHEHLTIAVWARHGDPDPLAEVEKRILKAWSPPLNLTHVAPTRLTALVKSARSAMADEARGV